MSLPAEASALPGGLIHHVEPKQREEVNNMAKANKRIGRIAGKTLGNPRSGSACKSLAGHALNERKVSRKRG
jgi:hypothetical protein